MRSIKVLLTPIKHIIIQYNTKFKSVKLKALFILLMLIQLKKISYLSFFLRTLIKMKGTNPVFLTKLFNPDSFFGIRI